MCRSPRPKEHAQQEPKIAFWIMHVLGPETLKGPVQTVHTNLQGLGRLFPDILTRVAQSSHVTPSSMDTCTQMSVGMFARPTLLRMLSGQAWNSEELETQNSNLAFQGCYESIFLRLEEFLNTF